VKTGSPKNHLTHPIHHTLTTKTPPQNTNFPKPPAKTPLITKEKSLSPRMRLVINPLHLPNCQLRISLRSRKPLMPQHLLNRPQIRTFFQHMRTESMPQRMRMHIRRQTTAQSNRLHNPPHTPRRQTAIPPHPQIRQQRPIMHQTRSASGQKLSLPQRQISP
jgi:hypothetical protein